jgi:hypothetical protein
VSGRAAPARSIAAVLAVVVSISGCEAAAVSPVGTWVSAEQGETLELRSDGTAIFTRESGTVDTLTWQADGTSLALGVAGGDTKTFGYSIEGGVLTLTFPGKDPVAYTRIESVGG